MKLYKLLLIVPLLATLQNAYADGHAGIPQLGGFEVDGLEDVYQSPWFGRYSYDDDLIFLDPTMSLVDSEIFGLLLFWGDWAWHPSTGTWVYFSEDFHPWAFNATLGWKWFDPETSDAENLGFYLDDTGLYVQVPRISNMRFPWAGAAGSAPLGARWAHASAVYDANPFIPDTISYEDFAADFAAAKTIGSVTALMPQASTAGDNPAFLTDGQSGDTDFPFISNMKPLATVGEYDAATGHFLTGWPDGDAAWLIDEDTVCVTYQSESYATMSWETYPQVMQSGVMFTGSKIHCILYDRAMLADFLNNGDAAAGMVKGAGFLFNRIFNVFGEEVVSKYAGGLAGTWGNQTLPDGTIVPFRDGMKLSQADFFFHSFCSSTYTKAHQWGPGIGFEDDIWMNGEEWDIGGSMFEDPATSYDTMGLASIVVDIANGVAYTAPALGQSGYEKPVPMNPQHEDYVVIVMSGYNFDSPSDRAPLRIYVGVKGKKADGSDLAPGDNQRDQFLGRNGLLYGKIYGLAVEQTLLEGTLGVTYDPTSRMLDAYMANQAAPDTFEGKFLPTSYTWGGWDNPVAVKDTEIGLWLVEEPTTAPGYVWFVSDDKLEHSFSDPDYTKSRFIQNLTDKSGVIGVDFTNIVAELAAANGALPDSLSANCRRIVPEWEGALTLEVGDKGVKHDGSGTHALDEQGQAMLEQPDGLIWVKAADYDALIIDEDAGNANGDRKMVIRIDPETMAMLEPGTGYFLAMAGGGNDPRWDVQASAYGNSMGRYSRTPESSATTSEFSGTWNLTSMLTEKAPGVFYSMAELAGTGTADVEQTVNLNDSVFMGVLQHRGESHGPVNTFRCDQGGQIFAFSLDLPAAQ